VCVCVCPDNNFRMKWPLPRYLSRWFTYLCQVRMSGLQSQFDSYTCAKITYAYRIRVRFSHQTAHVVALLSLKPRLPPGPPGIPERELPGIPENPPSLKFPREFAGMLNISQNCHFVGILIVPYYVKLIFFGITFRWTALNSKHLGILRNLTSYNTLDKSIIEWQKSVKPAADKPTLTTDIVGRHYRSTFWLTTLTVDNVEPVRFGLLCHNI